jgi:hypothetical protein
MQSVVKAVISTERNLKFLENSPKVGSTLAVAQFSQTCGCISISQAAASCAQKNASDE